MKHGKVVRSSFFFFFVQHTIERRHVEMQWKQVGCCLCLCPFIQRVFSILAVFTFSHRLYTTYTCNFSSLTPAFHSRSLTKQTLYDCDCAGKMMKKKKISIALTTTNNREKLQRSSLQLTINSSVSKESCLVKVNRPLDSNLVASVSCSEGSWIFLISLILN